MVVALLIVIVAELAVALELLRRNIGASSGFGWTPWRHKLADLFDWDEYGRETVIILAVLLVLLAFVSWFINWGMSP